LVIKPLEEDSTPGTVKPFQVSLVEPVAYQFQLFNLFNHAEFGFPGSSIGTAQFGRISGTTLDPRDVQLSMKFL